MACPSQYLVTLCNVRLSWRANVAQGEIRKLRGTIEVKFVDQSRAIRGSRELPGKRSAESINGRSRRCGVDYSEKTLSGSKSSVGSEEKT